MINAKCVLVKIKIENSDLLYLQSKKQCEQLHGLHFDKLIIGLNYLLPDI
jgi:hypothetical protein